MAPADQHSRPPAAPPGSTLADRAHDMLSARGGTASIADLAAHVFGTRTVDMWRPVLERILAADERFQPSGDDWRLRPAPTAAGPAADELVAVAIATTGSDPRRHRLLRLAAVRIADGRPGARFDVVLNPGRRLPAYLSRAASVTQEAADDAPSFEAVAEALREFLGSAPLVGYGARWTVDFLSAELARAQLPGLANPVLELDDLGRGLVIGGKPSLANLAAHLGISHSRPNHPPTDAAVTARVASALLARSAPHTSEDGKDRPRPATTGWALLDRRWLADVPERPGVYTILDDRGTVLYVGKAVNLRRRVAAYFGRAFGLHRQLEGLAARAARIETRATDSDIEARLEEARLIRQHRPPFNIQRSSRPRAMLIRAAPNASIPRLQVVRAPAADGALYIGPFPSERAARTALSLARGVYPLACSRRTTDLVAQRDAVQRAVRLLTRHKDEAIGTVRAEMRECSARGDRQGVDRARKLLRAVFEFEPRPSPLLGLPPNELLLVVEPARPLGFRRVHLVSSHALLASSDLPADADPADRAVLGTVAEELRAAAPVPDDEDAPIVQQWLGQLGPEYAIVPLRRLRQDTE